MTKALHDDLSQNEVDSLLREAIAHPSSQGTRLPTIQVPDEEVRKNLEDRLELAIAYWAIGDAGGAFELVTEVRDELLPYLEQGAIELSLLKSRAVEMTRTEAVILLRECLLVLLRLVTGEYDPEAMAELRQTLDELRTELREGVLTSPVTEVYLNDWLHQGFQLTYAAVMCMPAVPCPWALADVLKPGFEPAPWPQYNPQGVRVLPSELDVFAELGFVPRGTKTLACDHVVFAPPVGIRILDLVELRTDYPNLGSGLSAGTIGLVVELPYLTVARVEFIAADGKTSQVALVELDDLVSRVRRIDRPLLLPEESYVWLMKELGHPSAQSYAYIDAAAERGIELASVQGKELS